MQDPIEYSPTHWHHREGDMCPEDCEFLQRVVEKLDAHIKDEDSTLLKIVQHLDDLNKKLEILTEQTKPAVQVTTGLGLMGKFGKWIAEIAIIGVIINWLVQHFGRH